MVVFTNFSPSKNEEGVARTAVVSLTIVDDGYGIDINTLSLKIASQQVISGGNFVNEYSGKIFTASGKYVVGVYPKIPFFSKASKIDVYIEVYDGYSNLVVESYSFYTVGYNTPVADTSVSTPSRACPTDKPFFPPTDLGLVAALDKGVGTEVELQWKAAAPNNENNVIFYNVYYSTNRENVFDGYPEFLVSDTNATIGGLPPGDSHYFAVRVAEFDPLTFTISGLQQAGPSMFFYPSTSLDGYVSASATLIPAITDGFPTFGIIHLGTELVRYSSLSVTPPGFIVATNGRGYSGTIAESHANSIVIRLFGGKEDSNTNISRATPTFQKPNYALTWVKGDGYGPDGYRDGYDGYDAYYNNAPGAGRLFDGYDGYYIYKGKKHDSITTDGSNNDESGDFDRFDYCGTWRSHPQSFMQGQCVPSYFGGAQVRFDSEGNRHLVKVTDVRTHMLQREELLLESTGEPFILLRRMWTGTHCSCYMNRREHPDARCPICFSTGFVQGFIQFFNPRRADSRILVRVDPAVDDLNIVDRGGLEPQFEPTCWTLAFPAIKDRDILVRFNPNNLEEFRYEILDVTRVRAMFNQTGAQKFRIKRLPKTDIYYQYPTVRDTRPTPEALTTSVNAGPGLKAHSHQLIVRAGTDMSNIRVATLESEGHNHIIINGIVQNVLGHKHTL